MQKSFVSFTLAAGVMAAMVGMSPVAEAAPGGCFKYGLAGAAAGHMVHHGVRGFAAGCAAGMYRRHLNNKQMRQGAAVPANPT